MEGVVVVRVPGWRGRLGSPGEGSDPRCGSARSEAGAGTLEYVGGVIAVGALITGAALVFPSIGEQVKCKVSQAVGSITGGDSASCSSGTTGSQDTTAGSKQGQGSLPDGPTFSVTSKTTVAPTSGTNSFEFDVDAPDGEGWTVTSDQPWLMVTGGGGSGPGSFTAVARANPNVGHFRRGGEEFGISRTATLTFTGPNGETFTQEITQPGGTASTVVLGDSFSAGNGSWEKHPDETDRPDGYDGECNRSTEAWGPLLSNRNDIDVNLSAFGACGGATVDGTNLEGGTGHPSLLAEIEANRGTMAQADQVIFTIGGNDIGFSDILYPCVMVGKSASDCHDAVTEGRQRINGKDGQPSALTPQLEEAYRAALKAAPNATIYVVGYPHLVELDDKNSTLGIGEVKPENRREVVGLIDDLNTEMRNTVRDVNSSTPGGPRLVFVDPTTSKSPFNGHSLTDDDPYYNGAQLKLKWAVPPVASKPGSYHPNDEGNAAYAELISRYLRGDW